MAAGDDELKRAWIEKNGVTLCPPVPIDIRVLGPEYAARGFSDDPPWLVARRKLNVRHAAKMSGMTRKIRREV